MHASAEMTGWFQERNLAFEQPRVLEELPSEVVVYLLVMLATRPDQLPVGVVSFLATRYFSHCVEYTGTS